MEIQSKSPTKKAFLRLRRNPLARISLLVLFLLYAGAIFADFLAPYNYDNEQRALSYCPPTRLNFFDAAGKFIRRPFVNAYSYQFDENYQRVYRVDASLSYPLKFFLRGDKYKFLGLFDSELHLFGVQPPGRIYLLGADSRGRDLFTRIIHGSRVSLSIGLMGVAISFTIGMIVGGISGYYGGKIDNLIMRLCEMVMMVPAFYLMLALRAAFPPELSSVKVYLLIVFILSFIGWASLARVIRGMALSLRTKEFVIASQAQGLGDFGIILRHILPNTLSYCLIAVSLTVPGYIIGESALSLLGLGIQQPHASWGNLLSDAMNIAQIKFHPWILLPGGFIFVTVMAFNFLGDSLRDAFDPHMEMSRQL